MVLGMSASETPMFATGQKDGFSRAGRQPHKNANSLPKLGVDDLMETSKAVSELVRTAEVSPPQQYQPGARPTLG